MSHDTRGPRRYDNGNRGQNPRRNWDDRPRMEENILETQVLEGQRKTFTLTHRENQNGRFLRIDEVGRGRPNTIIVPEEEIEQFIDRLVKLFPTHSGI